MNQPQRRHPSQPPTETRPIPPRTLERLRALQAQIQQEVDACSAALDLPPTAQYQLAEGLIVIRPAVELAPEEQHGETDGQAA